MYDESLTENVIQRLRRSHFVIKIFYEIQSGFMCSIKLFMISVAILSNFVGIRYIHENSLLSFYGFYHAADVKSTFISKYDHAFSIRLLADHTGGLILLWTLRKGCGNTRVEFELVKRQLRSFPTLGIKLDLRSWRENPHMCFWIMW